MADRAASRTEALTDALAAQSGYLRAWVHALFDDDGDGDFARPTVLPGWDVARLIGHLVLIHRGLAGRLDDPSDAQPLAPQEFVRRYRRDVDQIDAATLAQTVDRSPAELVAALDAAADAALERLRGDVPAVIDTPRGPIRGVDYLRTRIVELIVHSDDLSRSRPDRSPVALDRGALGVTVRELAEIFAAQTPGRSVELRVVPFVAVQAVPGPRHTRGTPANVIETDALTWLRLATGRAAWDAAIQAGAVRASGQRADLTEYLPVLS